MRPAGDKNKCRRRYNHHHLLPSRLSFNGLGLDTKQNDTCACVGAGRRGILVGAHVLNWEGFFRRGRIAAGNWQRAFAPLPTPAREREERERRGKWFA